MVRGKIWCGILHYYWSVWLNVKKKIKANPQYSIQEYSKSDQFWNKQHLPCNKQGDRITWGVFNPTNFTS